MTIQEIDQWVARKAIHLLAEHDVRLEVNVSGKSMGDLAIPLKYLPLDYLKIDGDFIRSLTSSVTDQLVVKSMVDIARGMGMKTIAEFVEAADTVAMLREKGVDYPQGYFHGAPRPGRDRVRRLEVPHERRRSTRVPGRAPPSGSLRHDQARSRLLRQPGCSTT